MDLSGTPKGVLEIVATFNGPAPSGVAVSKHGRIFLSFPRHAVDHNGPTLAELKGGQLVPFPNAALNPPSGGNPSETLVSVHGITMDAQDRLWVIDDGKRAGKPIEPGAAKVVGFDINTGELVRKVVLSPPALLPDSHMNDLRVDLTHGSSGMAYVADSSFGESPALVIVDLATGKAERRLAHHVSTQPEKGFMVVIEGRPMLYEQGLPPTFPTGGVDGVALSPDSSRLYYAPLTSRHLYSIPTAVLANRSASTSELAAAVVDEGEKGAADGLAVDQMGRLYTTNHELDAILRRQPDGRFEVFARDPRLLWPDGICVSPNGYVYFTVDQSQRLPQFNGGRDLRQPPFLLIRAPVNGVPSSN